MLLRLSMAPTIVHKFGLYAAIVTILWLRHGTAEHLSVLITQSALLLLGGLAIPNGSKKCGKADLIEWLPI